MPDVNLKDLLDRNADRFNRPGFIESDPVQIPHLFTKKQDIEIMGFFAAILAWGQRRTIINKCRELVGRFGGAPHDFILHHQDADLKNLLGFKHRTFNDTDLLYFTAFLREHYRRFDSLEDAFLIRREAEKPFSMEKALDGFKAYFFSLPDHPNRTRKHVSSPLQRSACKRLNMFLRWMVRRDGRGVDFGIWQRIRPADLICPCDVHVLRTALRLGLTETEKSCWKTATELTEKLKLFDPEDPVKYDFALFGMGAFSSS